MKVSELGEFGLIDLLARKVSSLQKNQPAPRQLVIGIGDDAAVWHGEATTQLATVDSLIQDVHFSLNTISWQELGWKALAVNLSDIAAMGGVPGYALVSLALPGNTEVADVSALYEGMIELAQQFQIAVAGGDTCQAPVVAITITVLGSAGEHILTRSSARPGDKIAVTGYLGSAAAGLDMLSHRLQFEPGVTAYLSNAFRRPQPRIAEGLLLVREGVTTAIDISDGLLADLRQIGKASRVSARLEVDRLPIQPILRDNFGDRALALAVAGGEDYELLFTAGTEVINRVKKKAPCPVTIIGEITAGNPGEVSLFDTDGNLVNLHEAGWEHFKTG
jgi:thiamine-monophosphate kinase